MKNKKPLNNLEIASFCQQMAMIIRSGITASEGLDILIHDTVDEKGKAVLLQISDSINMGEHFHDALDKTGLFPIYVVKLISLGEETGKLDSVLQSLGDHYEREQNISDSIKNALTYPLIMIGMMFLIILVLISKVLPIFKQVFEELGTDMSPLALSLMKVGNSLSNASISIVAVVIILIVGFYIAYKIPSGRKALLRFFNSFPLTKSFFQKIACGRFASGLFLAFSSGMDIYHAMDMIADFVENKDMEKKISVCKDTMLEGEDLPTSLTKSEIFSALYSRMVSVGFRSGSVDSVMKQIADHYEDETDEQLTRIISIIEPTLVIILSLIVGIILLSVLLPLMGIMSSIG